MPDGLQSAMVAGAAPVGERLLESALSLSFSPTLLLQPGAGDGVAPRDFVILHANPAAARLFGRAAGGDLGAHPLSSLIGGPGALALRLELEAAMRMREPRSFAIEAIAGLTTERLAGRAMREGNELVVALVGHDGIDDAERGEMRRLRALVEMLCRAVGVRDPYTAGHLQRVAAIAGKMAERLALSPERIELVRLGALLHDVGKIGLPGDLLIKPAPLSGHERGLIETHSEIGLEILGDHALPSTLIQIVLQHHERLDGSGYPHGIDAADMLEEAQIVAVADVIEAMSAHRPYRPAIGVNGAFEELRKGRGSRYSSDAVEAAIAVFADTQPTR